MTSVVTNVIMLRCSLCSTVLVFRESCYYNTLAEGIYTLPMFFSATCKLVSFATIVEQILTSHEELVRTLITFKTLKKNLATMHSCVTSSLMAMSLPLIHCEVRGIPTVYLCDIDIEATTV